MINKPMRNTPLASIIILSYNNTHLLKKAINSVMQQDYPNIEVIIHDDGSQDFDSKKIKAYFDGAKENISNIIIYSNDENVGTVRNFNAAIEKSKGEVIIPLACDDCFYSNNSVSVVMERFSKGAQLCTAKKIGEITHRISPSKFECELINKGGNEFKESLLYSYYISGACTYYSRELLVKNELFNTEYVLIEDQPFILQYALQDNKIELIDEIVLIYNESGVSSSKSPHPLCLQDQKKIYEEIILPASNNTRRIVRRYAEYVYLRSYVKCNKYIVSFKYIDVLFVRMIERLFKCNYYIEKIARIR